MSCCRSETAQKTSEQSLCYHSPRTETCHVTSDVAGQSGEGEGRDPAERVCGPGSVAALGAGREKFSSESTFCPRHMAPRNH